jgi:urea transporter
MFIAKDISPDNSNVGHGLLGYDAMLIGNLLTRLQRSFLPP